MKKVLIATVKPFAAEAVNQIKPVFEDAGYELSLLENYADQSDLVNAVSDCDAMIIRSDKATKEVLDAAKNLKIIVRAGAGYDNIDLDAATQNDVVAMNTPGQNSNAVAELAFGMMLFQARNKFLPKAGRELKGKKLGIHAYGNVGRIVAKLAQSFGMQVCAYDPFIDQQVMEADGVKVMKSVEDLYSACNYISLHIPSNDKTKESINYDLLSKMPDYAILVNTARKEVINDADLLKIFETKKGFQYVSDLAPTNADVLLEKYADRCFFTPKKMGAQTAEANINAGVAAANQIVNFFEKGDVTFKVN